MLQRGQVVVLELMMWPGTTREILQPILEEGSGLKAGHDFHLAMWVSPSATRPAKNQARRGAQVGRHDRRAVTAPRTPLMIGGIAFEPDFARPAAASPSMCMKRFSKIVSTIVPTPSGDRY